jgi:hypothetical protein
MPKKSKKQLLAEFNAMLHEMAALILDKVKSEVRRKKWKYAFWDVRSPVGGGSCISKLRVVLPDGNMFVCPTLVAPPTVRFQFLDMLDVKDQIFRDKWYGLKLILSPDGKCQTEFNDDPNCINDPTFYDVDEDLKR